jgi:hypothetical protein
MSNPLNLGKQQRSIMMEISMLYDILRLLTSHTSVVKRVCSVWKGLVIRDTVVISRFVKRCMILGRILREISRNF